MTARYHAHHNKTDICRTQGPASVATAFLLDELRGADFEEQAAVLAERAVAYFGLDDETWLEAYGPSTTEIASVSLELAAKPT